MQKIKNRLKSQKGQVAIFVLMIFSLLFMFFGMAINIGMLVHHKINLQNAADMAALSAAAEQARILNMMGWKNYELRKNFKDFVYNYWIEMNDQHKDFPDPFSNRAANLQFQGPWTNNPGRGTFTVPSYCLGKTFGEPPGSMITCQRSGVPGTFVSPPSGILGQVGIEPVSVAWLTFLNNLAANQQIAADNQWNDYSNFNQAVAGLDVANYKIRSEDIYEHYLSGNPYTLPWIMNLAMSDESLQERPQLWEDFEIKWTQWNKSGKRLMDYYASPHHEVPKDFNALARKTAFNNLNRNLRRNFQFTALKPEAGYVKLNPVYLDFTIFWTSFELIGSQRMANRYNEIPVGNYVAGVEKDTSVKTFYALALTSEPQLPFLPGGKPWRLTAVSAAQPFGSRIGPNAAEVEDSSRTFIPQLNHFIPSIAVDESQSIDDTQVLFELKAEGEDYEGLWETHKGQTAHRHEPILTPLAWEAARYIFPSPETSQRQPLHWTDQPMGQPGAFTQKYGAQNLGTSWQGRAGYSMKLIPMQSIVDWLAPQ
ncbi:MAG: hypothetical protein HYY62_05510, partial [Deltaproteobacteria bacterium]|nr:hypothetical protein [Deltaproteobacteria bacterium]